MVLLAGSLRDRVQLLRAERVQQPNGEVCEKWVEYADVRAQVIQQRSSRALNNGENWYPEARAFRLRMPPRVKGGDRIAYNGELYLCLSPKIYQSEGYQEVDCELIND